jgi:nicotinate phosphoribosyltransferase
VSGHEPATPPLKRDMTVIDPLRSALLTDLYELTMTQAYSAEKMEGIVVFELFFRSMPGKRNFIMAAGLDSVLDYLQNWKFTADDLSYLRSLGLFSGEFIDELRQYRFSGDVHAVPEGTIVFENEPLLQIVAPLKEAQIPETVIINQIHLQSLAATKAARMVEVVAGRTVVDFGSRRAHGIDAALKVARSSYLAGFAGTSNVLAGKMYGVPVFGTMAHSYVQAHDDEGDSFTAFSALYPHTTLLVDTYDTIKGVTRVIELSRELGDRFRLKAVRLDSGDLETLTRTTRSMLDRAGLRHIGIFISGGLDEYKMQSLIRQGACFDGAGVGTNLVVSDDVPYLDMVYKLVEYDGSPRTKLSANKTLYPGRKQVFRRYNEDVMAGDVIGSHDENLVGRPLLKHVMKNGRRLEAGQVSLNQARDYARLELAGLPEKWRALEKAAEPYPVTISEKLEAELRSLKKQTQ